MKFTVKNNFITKSSTERLHKSPLPLIGLTGGIATGKSSVSKIFTDTGIDVICADILIKEIYMRTETVNWIKANFSGSIKNNKIDFKILRSLAFNDILIKEKLEQYLYPKLFELFKEKVEIIKNKNKQDFIIYDIPLLFEKDFQNNFDQIICVYATIEKQIDRVMKRDNIDTELTKKIIKNQINIEDKKSKSDIVIDNNTTPQNLIINTKLVLKDLFNINN